MAHKFGHQKCASCGGCFVLCLDCLGNVDAFVCDWCSDDGRAHAVALVVVGGVAKWERLPLTLDESRGHPKGQA